MGKTMVELFSSAIVVKVCKYLKDT